MKWLVFFLMLPHLKPASLEHLWPVGDRMFDVLRIFSALLIVFLYILKRKLPSKPVWFLAVFQGWILMITILKNQGYIQRAVVSAVSIISVVLLVDFFSGSIRQLLRGLLLDMEIVCYANLISVYLFPSLNYGGPIGDYFLMGHRNGFIQYVLLTVVIALLYMREFGRSLRPIILIIAGCLPVIRAWSATSICGLIVFGCVMLAGKTKISTLITFPKIFIATAAIDLAISVFRIMDRVLLVSQFIESFLRRNITLTGRTALWDIFYKRFKVSPWIGYGTGAATVGNWTAHNQWFQFLYEGGIVGLALFLLFSFVSVGRMMKWKHSSTVFIFYAAFAAMYTVFIADVFCRSPWFYVVFILAYHIDKFELAAMPRQERRIKSGRRASVA